MDELFRLREKIISNASQFHYRIFPGRPTYYLLERPTFYKDYYISDLIQDREKVLKVLALSPELRATEEQPTKGPVITPSHTSVESTKDRGEGVSRPSSPQPTLEEVSTLKSKAAVEEPIEEFREKEQSLKAEEAAGKAAEEGVSTAEPVAELQEEMIKPRGIKQGEEEATKKVEKMEEAEHLQKKEEIQTQREELYSDLEMKLKKLERMRRELEGTASQREEFKIITEHNADMEEEERPKLSLKIPYLESHKPVEVPIPTYLSTPPQKRAYNIVKEIQSLLTKGQSVDKSSLLRELLSLTKKLLEEEDLEKKRRIREEIAKIKSMLNEKGGVQQDTLRVVVSYLEKECGERIREFKDLIEGVKQSIDSAYQQSLEIVSGEKKQEVDELYRKDMEELRMQATNLSEKLSSYLIELFTKALELSAKEFNLSTQRVEKEIHRFKDVCPKKIREALDEVLPSAKSAPQGKEEIEERMVKEEVKGGIIKPVEEKEEEKVGESLEPEEEMSKEEVASRIVDTVLSQNEVQLLHYLSKMDKPTFRSYIIGKISKEEAKERSRQLMLQELAEKEGVEKELVLKKYTVRRNR